MNFQREILTEELIDELIPMLEDHWKEIAHYKDIPLKVNRKHYLAAEESGSLRVFTARQPVSGSISGYAVFVVNWNAHYSDSLQAVQDVLFVEKKLRGTMAGPKLIKWCDERLADEGVQVVYHHVKDAHDFGPVLERIGYEPIERIYGRRLDRWE